MQARLTRDQLAAMRDGAVSVYDRAGDEIGGIASVLYDKATEDPEWVGVSTGFLGTKTVLVPLAGASLETDGLHVPYTKDQVRDAPDIRIEGGEISEADEQALYQYYGLSYSQRRSASDLPESTTPRVEGITDWGREVTERRRPAPTREPLVVSSSGGQAGKNRLASGRRVVVTATRRISGRPSQGRLVGISIGSLAAIGGLGAAWLLNHRQRERKRPINQLRRTAAEIGERVPRRDELVQYLPDREAAGLAGGLGRGLALLMLGMLLGWALRGQRLRTTRVTVTEVLPGTEAPTDLRPEF